MRSFDSDLAEMRFGYGLSPEVAAPTDVGQMLAGLTSPDVMADRFPTEPFCGVLDRLVQVLDARVEERKHRDTPQEAVAYQRRRDINNGARLIWADWIGRLLSRRVHTPTGFRERLVAFWADHFTAFGRQRVMRLGAAAFVDEAIRPFVGLRFADLLQSAVMHPMMLDYLDQARSMGPNSDLALRRGARKPSGLNENLAREVMELHTLGVGGPYTQKDVTELAELFSGMTFQAKLGYHFREVFVEPGSETVLDKTYPDAYDEGPIRAVLEDLAAHPATARHIASKLAVHFTRDDPDAALVDALADAYLAHDGSLLAVYEALLEHPAAWEPQLINYKPPIDFVSSALRALGPEQLVIEEVTPQQIRQYIVRPLIRMGQHWERPIGPDGWSEEDADWITPQGLAARVTWSMQFPQAMMPTLPDPRDFVHTALGPMADEAVQFAAKAAESKSEAIGLVLMSPAFQRR